jgi:CDGSH-type Zn-finger protein
LYVFNGFFMEMRSKFTDPSVSLHYYVVEFDSSKLSWKDFRGQLLGPTDPATAPAGSLRGKINAQWESLGLAAAPNVGDNGVHASASPFEGLAERLNWVGAKLESDPFGSALLAAGFPADTIAAWSVDPQVNVDAAGKMGSVFDSLEDTDASECLEKLKQLAGFNGVKLTAAPKFGPIANPKASPTVVTIAAGQSAYLCTCGQSAKFPLCDGAHKAYNAANGTAIRPQAVKNESDAAIEKWVCACGFSESRPLCDGTHASLSQEQQQVIQTAAAAHAKKQLGQKIRCWATYGVIGVVSAYIIKKAVDAFNNKK